jgi:GNAT superfamily N-acetyltransferase
VQKISRQQGKAVIAATTHSDLFEDLKPSVFVRKRFGEEIKIDYYPNTPAVECSIIKEMTIEVGTKEDWLKLCGFHYRGHKYSVPRKIFRLVRGDELCGVIVYSYPPPACYGRRLVLPRMSMLELNKELSIINRVVIHPKYRTIGLGAKLIGETLPLAGTRYVELIAVMAKYSPFAEKAGMQKVSEQKSVKSVSKVSEVLQGLGFDLQLIGSAQYIQAKLENLSVEETAKLKEAFIKDKHPRFKRELACSHSSHQPFGNNSDYIKAVLESDNAKIGALIKLAGMLRQTKVYLFWRKENTNKH